MIRTYSECMKIETYGDRLEYLKLLDGNATSPRHISNQFYKSHLWLTLRNTIIERDMAFDMAVMNKSIEGPILVHHINPINERDITYRTPKLTDPENLITVSLITHNFIHYGSKIEPMAIRKAGDTKLW